MCAFLAVHVRLNPKNYIRHRSGLSSMPIFQALPLPKVFAKEASHVVVDLRWPRQARSYSNSIHREPSDNPSTAAM
jgi:hypothetical protein